MKLREEQCRHCGAPVLRQRLCARRHVFVDPEVLTVVTSTGLLVTARGLHSAWCPGYASPVAENAAEVIPEKAAGPPLPARGPGF